MTTNTIDTERSITIVSGLPRSGTSMMMQMLAAGGIPVLSDNMRQADEDNPQDTDRTGRARLPAAPLVAPGHHASAT